MVIGNVAVVFVKSYLGYNAGEVAGFTDAYAERLVSLGVAKRYKPEPPSSSAVSAPVADRAMPSARGRKKGGSK